MVHVYKKAIKRIIRANKLHNLSNPFRNAKAVDVKYDLTFNGIWSLTNKQTISNSCDKSIIVVLESPHIDEFNDPNRFALSNDVYFKRKFVNAFLNSKTFQKSKVTLNQKQRYKVYLINAIQFQCSLGIPTQYYRDYVFCYYWDRMKNDFKNRLRSIINNSKKVLAVINLCTKGSHEKCTQLYNCSTKNMDVMYKKCGKKFLSRIFGAGNAYSSLSDMVNSSIKEVCTNIPISTGKHPSSWGYSHTLIN